MKLGLGEVEQADRNAYSIQFTRIRFLIVIEKIKPKILLDAARGPLPLFQTLLSEVPPDEFDAFCTHLNAGWHFLESLPSARAFLDSLKMWAQKWYLDTDWCIESTLMAMRRYYSISPKYRNVDQRFSDKRFSWFYPLDKFRIGSDAKAPYVEKLDNIFDFPFLADHSVDHVSLVNPPSPPGSLPSFEPYHNTIEGYLSFIEREARRRLDGDAFLSVINREHRYDYSKLVTAKAKEYAQTVTACAEGQGLRKTKTKPKLRKHLEWAVRVWVLGENYTSVARSAARDRNGKNLSSKAVCKAVEQTLLLIEPSWADRLEKRFPRGRPRGT